MVLCRVARGNFTPGLPQSEVGRRRGARGSGPFPSAPSRTGLASCPRIRLSSALLPGGDCGASGVDVLVAAFADHKGLAAALGHPAYPRRVLGSSLLVENREVADGGGLAAG